MLHERRRTPRHIVNRGARILSHADAAAQDCVIADMSDGGVRLITGGVEVPDEFILLAEGLDPADSKCRVVWRLDNEIGAEFVDDDELQ